MLARIDKEFHPARASVNREGTVLRLEGVDPEQVSSIKTRVISLIEETGFLAEAMPDATPVARWYSLEEADELLQEEARILAGRCVDEMRAEGALSDSESDPARRALEQMLLSAFREAAATGKIEIQVHRLASSGSELVSKEVLDRLLNWVSHKLG